MYDEQNPRTSLSKQAATKAKACFVYATAPGSIVMGINLQVDQTSQLVPVNVALERALASTESTFNQDFMGTYSINLMCERLCHRMQ